MLAQGIPLDVVVPLYHLYRKLIRHVKMNGNVSSAFDQDDGIAQGSPNSTKFFNLYTDDLHAILEEYGMGISVFELKIILLTFCDDFALPATSVEQVQRVLSIVYKWARRWKLTFSREMWCPLL